jgi:hypothetical protein
MKLFLGYLILFLCLTATAYASGTYSFSVSCTIPAIPGVNAPVITEQTSLDNSAVKTEKENQTTPNATQQTDEIQVTQTSTRDTQPQKSENQPLLVTTIYDR